ncbi:hypothetical protein R1flu_018362 [Riccia fluitans]|uniref:Uncharacterized protein n=1 Tax=Riccia fluitans TaxID=41844 RepID=A0ABD1ZFM3_9MARC
MSDPLPSAFPAVTFPDVTLCSVRGRASTRGAKLSVSLSHLLKQLDISLDSQQSLEFGPESYVAELQPFVDCEEHIQNSAGHGNRKGPAPDIIDYLRNGLRRTTAYAKRHPFPLPGIRNNNYCASPKACPQPSVSEQAGAVQTPQSFGDTVC